LAGNSFLSKNAAYSSRQLRALKQAGYSSGCSKRKLEKPGTIISRVDDGLFIMCNPFENIKNCAIMASLYVRQFFFLEKGTLSSKA